jgi:DNA-binding FadR family transcriptional regulator
MHPNVATVLVRARLSEIDGMAFTRPKRTSLGEQIVVQLEAAIRSGTYAVGDALPSERELMATFGVSRVAVREALIALQVKGLISRDHGRPSRVLSTSLLADAIAQLQLTDDLSEEHVAQVQQARVLIEAEAARLAALRASRVDITRLRNAVDTNRKSISDRDAFLASDMAFHRVIGEVSGNGLYTVLSQAMMVWLAGARRRAVHLEGSQMLSHHEHASIADAIIARDPERAGNCMREHLLRLNAAYERFDEVPEAAGGRQRRSSLSSDDGSS